METDGFYGLLAQVTFTVLAFWLAVAQVAPRALLASADRRRAAHAVSLQLALPATMSLLALVDPGNGLVWRAAFVAGAAWGVAAVLLLRPEPGPRTVAWQVDALAWAVLALWAGVLLAAVVPGRVYGYVGIPLRPIEVEAGLLAVLVFLTLNQAFWLVFDHADPARSTEHA